jgi:hypothetical protein
VDQLEKKFKKQFTQLKAQLKADDEISELEVFGTRIRVYLT